MEFPTVFLGPTSRADRGGESRAVDGVSQVETTHTDPGQKD
ncbi:MAG: hypothetical protein ACYS7Y_11900 [Planctomycetota bacterium]